MDRDHVETKIHRITERMHQFMQEDMDGSATARDMYEQQQDELHYWMKEKSRLDRIDEGLRKAQETEE